MASNSQFSSFKRFIIVAIIVIFMAVTNPTKDDFMDYVMKHVDQNSNSNNEQSAFEQLGISLGKALISNIIVRDDYIILSKYSVNYEGKKVTFIGLFKKVFIKL